MATIEPLDGGLQDLTNEQLAAYADEIGVELNRRRVLETIPAQVEMLNRQFLNAEGIREGEDWKQPAGAHDAYPLAWKVVHGGKTWISTVANNVWEPGTTGWREVVVEGGIAEFVQPAGAHDAYQIGDKVRFGGSCYESSIADNVWPPDVLPSGWTDIPCP